MNQSEEFSSPDVRNTLGEVWRVVTQRRAWFGAAFCALASLAFLCSHWIPRKYTGTTLFERRNDMVLQSVIGLTWDQTYEAQRRSLAFDLTGPAALADALDRTDAGKALPRDASGKLTPDGEGARDLLLQKLPEELEVKMIESTPQRDVVEVRMTDGDPTLAAQLVVAIRDSYAERSKAKLRGLLSESLEYFNREARQTTDHVRTAERRIRELEKAFPGLAADFVTMAASEAGALTLERAELRRRVLELKETERSTSESLRSESEAPPETAAPPTLRDNPRRQELASEMARLEQMITDEKVLHGKTDEHPSVLALHDKWERLREAYRAEPKRVPDTARATGMAGGPRKEPSNLATVLAATQQKILESESRGAAVELRLNELDALRTAATEKRPEYLTLKETLTRRQAEMNGWQERIEPIHRIMSAQGHERGVQFISFREPGTITRPTSPDARAIMLACLAVGLAGGAATVVLREFSDRSFRTALQVSRSLALPVLETIEEIVTPVVRRRRLVKHLVLAPVAAVALVVLVVGTGTAAYLSLEAHDTFERLKRNPWHPLRVLRDAREPSAAADPIGGPAASRLSDDARQATADIGNLLAD